MTKSMPNKEFKEAVSALNAVLKADEKSTIKIVAVKKAKVIEDFTNAVLDFIENDKIKALPESVIDFYNEFIAEDAPDDVEDVSDADVSNDVEDIEDVSDVDVSNDVEDIEDVSDADVPDDKKTKKTKKTKKIKKSALANEKKKEKKEKLTTSPGKNLGIVAEAVRVYILDNITTTKEIVEVIQDKFPGRNITSTVSTVVCVMKHVNDNS